MSAITPLTGAVWGLAGALAMVVVMNLRGGEAPPPFAVFWAKFLGDGDPAGAMPQAMSLHAGYALVAGTVYAAGVGPVGASAGLGATTLVGGVVLGLVWALVLLVVAMAFWGRLVLDLDPGPAQRRTLVLAHAAYGLTLGVLGAAVPHLL